MMQTLLCDYSGTTVSRCMSKSLQYVIKRITKAISVLQGEKVVHHDELSQNF